MTTPTSSLSSLARPRTDAHRPVYHFTAPGGWLNDPNGVAYHAGRWHVHYQHNPGGPFWNHIVWGHVSSTDLMTWRHEPVALRPTPGGPDEDGCFSGSFAEVGGVPTLYYTGVSGGTNTQAQCRATSTDLITWTKDPRNPVIATPPPGVRHDDFRDPYVFRHGEHWYMVVAASLEHERGAALLYRSPDGQDWTYRGVLHAAATTEQGRVWECLNFFPLGERWVLIYSLWTGLGVRYALGRFEHECFVPEHDGLLDPDGSAFAHLSAQGADGRWLQWAWIPEQRDQAHVDEGGWAGALSVPRELRLEDGRLLVAPATEVAAQRGEALVQADAEIGEGAHLPFRGAHLDIELELPADLEHPVHLTLRASPDGAEGTVLTYDPGARQLRLTRRASSLDPRVNLDTQRAHLAARPGEGLRLRVLLDASVLEVYTGTALTLTGRVYPTRGDSVGGFLSASKPTQVRLGVWRMPGGG
jgi:beta-fructofuranosidase